jgi:hypothetical protein
MQQGLEQMAARAVPLVTAPRKPNSLNNRWSRKSQSDGFCRLFTHHAGGWQKNCRQARNPVGHQHQLSAESRLGRASAIPPAIPTGRFVVTNSGSRMSVLGPLPSALGYHLTAMQQEPAARGLTRPRQSPAHCVSQRLRRRQFPAQPRWQCGRQLNEFFKRFDAVQQGFATLISLTTGESFAAQPAVKNPVVRLRQAPCAKHLIRIWPGEPNHRQARLKTMRAFRLRIRRTRAKFCGGRFGGRNESRRLFSDKNKTRIKFMKLATWNVHRCLRTSTNVPGCSNNPFKNNDLAVSVVPGDPQKSLAISISWGYVWGYATSHTPNADYIENQVCAA